MNIVAVPRGATVVLKKKAAATTAASHATAVNAGVAVVAASHGASGFVSRFIRMFATAVQLVP